MRNLWAALIFLAAGWGQNSEKLTITDVSGRLDVSGHLMATAKVAAQFFDDGNGEAGHTCRQRRAPARRRLRGAAGVHVIGSDADPGSCLERSAELDIVRERVGG